MDFIYLLHWCCGNCSGCCCFFFLNPFLDCTFLTKLLLVVNCCYYYYYINSSITNLIRFSINYSLLLFFFFLMHHMVLNIFTMISMIFNLRLSFISILILLSIFIFLFQDSNLSKLYVIILNTLLII